MLVYQRKDLPSDPVFPTDLEKLGYFINDQDQIRQIKNPDNAFKYKVNANERWNDVRLNAFNECIRRTVLSRLKVLGLSTLRLPLNAQPRDRHVPILHSANLSTAKRIIVVLSSPDQDLAIWTYKSISEVGINAGSMVNFAKAVLLKQDYDDDDDDDQRLDHNELPDGDEIAELRAKKRKNNGNHKRNDDTALLIANPGQLIYHCSSGKALSRRSWLALPVESAAHLPLKQTYRNAVPGNANWREHVKYIFEHVLAPTRLEGGLINADTPPKIDIIGVEEGGLAAVEYLAENWSNTWSKSISAMCLVRPLHSKVQLGTEQEDVDREASFSFRRFMATRCRAYLLSDKALGWPVPGTNAHGCNTYSSGEAVNYEDAIVSSWGAMLHWLDMVHDDPLHAEVEFVIEEMAINDEGWKTWAEGVPLNNDDETNDHACN